MLGFWLFENYNRAAGKVGDTPTHDMHAGATQMRQSRLLLFLHPHCPCSLASLNGLAEVLSNATIRPVEAQVLFVLPPGAADDWQQSSLWQSAAAIPKAQARLDQDGVLARHFGIKTSGHVLFFDADGRLRYSGGLTASRGHDGDSAGRDAVMRLLTGRVPSLARAPVFGCALFDYE